MAELVKDLVLVSLEWVSVSSLCVSHRSAKWLTKKWKKSRKKGLIKNEFRTKLIQLVSKQRQSLVLMAIVVIGIYLGFKREFSKLIGFLVIALIAVGLVFNAGGVKDVLLELFNRIIGA